MFPHYSTGEQLMLYTVTEAADGAVDALYNQLNAVPVDLYPRACTLTALRKDNLSKGNAKNEFYTLTTGGSVGLKQLRAPVGYVFDKVTSQSVTGSNLKVNKNSAGEILDYEINDRIRWIKGDEAGTYTCVLVDEVEADKSDADGNDILNSYMALLVAPQPYITPLKKSTDSNSGISDI